MQNSLTTLTVILTSCCLLAAVAMGAADKPANQLGDPEDSWAEQRADNGLELSIMVSPQTINFDSQAAGDWMTVHTDIPYAYIAADTVALNGIPAAYTYADDRGNLVATFDILLVIAIVEVPATELTLTGVTDDGIPFEGSDIVKVLDPLA